MGIIKLRFKATRGGKTETFTAIVDSGADVTNLNQDTACELGLDMKIAKKTQMHTGNGATFIGFELTDVKLKHKRREATLKRVFVPIRVEVEDHNGTHGVNIAPDDAQLIGHDFLQAAGAFLDFEKHELRGTPPKYVSAHVKPIYRPATPEQRARLKAATCRVKRRRR